MAKDNLRRRRAKIDEIIKAKRKMATQDASPETSSSRRSSRDTSSSKQTKEIPSSTRKSKRLEKNKPSESPPATRKSRRTQEQVTITPMKKYGRPNKPTSVGLSATKKLVEDPDSSSMKSKNEKVKRSLKMDSKEDEKQENQALHVDGRKRKRLTTSVVMGLSSSQQKRTEAANDNDNDKESQDESSQATSSSNKDVENRKDTNSASKSAEDKGDDDDDVEECSDRTGEESKLQASETQCSTSNSNLTNFSVEETNDPIEVEESPDNKQIEEVHHDAVKEQSNDRFVDLEHVENGINGKSSSSKKDAHTHTPTQKTDPDVCTDIKEFWVPIQISNVQLEQYCSMLLTNAMALSSCSKSDTVGALHDILVSNRKCCDHPYIVDQSLQATLTKDLEPAKFLEVGIKASGKLQFLDLILPAMRKRELRILILFQPLSGTGKDSASIGDILDDFLRQRFGEDSYERVDAVITTPSRRQAALNNFNNKEMGRFVFLLDYRACLPSIKLSSVDNIIIFDSEWNPANDLRALQKIAIDSNPEQIKIFRLYTLWTLEEKILKLSEHNVTIGLQNLSRSTSDALLMWGATYLFDKLTEFHCANASSEEYLWSELKDDFLNLVSNKHYTSKLIITRVQQSCQIENLSLPNELPGGEQPHMFWRKLLAGRDPCWKYLTILTPRQRKRTQYHDILEKASAGSDDVGRKRKKTTTTPVTEKGETNDNSVIVLSSDGSQLSPGDSISGAATCNETSFRHLLKLNINELCRVLKLSEEVKKMVERFLEYVIENYQVNKEPANTLQAFLISLCWIGSGLLNKKLDRKQSLSIAKKRLNFNCEEEETNSVYLKLEAAKDMFLLHTNNKKKTNVSQDFYPYDVKVENLHGPEDEGHVTTSPDTSDVPEDLNDNSLPPAPASQEIHPSVQPLAPSPPPTNSVEIRIESIQDTLQTKDAEKVDVSITETPLVEQQQHEAPPQVLKTTVDDPNHAAAQSWSNLFNLQEFESYNRGPTLKPSYSEPLQAELEKLNELKSTINNFYEAIKGKLRSEYEQERAEMIAKINRKYEDKSQKAEAAYQSKRKEIDINFNKVIMNKILAEAYRSKCRDLNPFDHSQIQREMQHLQQFHGQPSSSPGQSSGSYQVNNSHQTAQYVRQSANLFSHTPTIPPPSSNHHFTPSAPTRPPSNINTATRPPPTIPSTRPLPTISSIRPPPPHMNHLSTQNKPPPNITTTTPSVRNQRVGGEIRAPAPHIRPFKPSTSVPPHDHASHRVMTGQQHASSSLPPSSATFSHTPAKPSPPPSPQIPPNHNSHPTQPPLPPSSFPTNPNGHPPQPVAPTLPPSPQMPPNQNSHPTHPPVPPSTQIPPSFSSNNNSHPPQPVAPPPLPPSSEMPTNHNSHPTQPPVSPSSQIPPSFPPNDNSHPPQPEAPPLPPSSQMPTNHNSHPTQPEAPPPPPSIKLPPLHSLNPSEQHPPGNPPATSSSSMPSIPISNTGLYSSSGRFMELLKNVDEQVCFHQRNNVVPPPSEVLEPTAFGKNGGDIVCLSDDD